MGERKGGKEREREWEKKRFLSLFLSFHVNEDYVFCTKKSVPIILCSRYHKQCEAGTLTLHNTRVGTYHNTYYVHS